MENNSNNMNKESIKSSPNKKLIWGIVLALLLAIAASAGIYVSNLKETTPTENENVIALVPEESDVQTGDDTAENADAASTEDETVQVEVPKSTLRKGTTYTAVKNEKRQVGTLDAEMTVEDDVQIWQSETHVDIFDRTYYGTKAAGTENEITVENEGHKNLIAPGTEEEYTFWVKNTGQVGIDYWVSFEEHDTPGYDIPLEVRVKCGDAYILGSKNKWEPMEKLDFLKHEGHLSVKNYAQYTLEWRWQFEIDDEYDTYLGNEAVNKDIVQEIIIHTYGEGYDRPIYETFSVTGVKTGDSANVLLWIILLILAIVAMYFIRKNTKKHKGGE